MRVTLIEPPRFYAPTSAISTVVIPPLGPAYIASVLREAGHEVRVVDGLLGGVERYTPYAPGVYVRGLGLDEIVDKVPADTQLIGISCMFSATWLIVRDLAIKLKEKFPNVPLVLGGEHGTGMPELSMKQAPLDYVVLGEGEDTIVELAGLLRDGKPADSVEGTAARLAGGEVRVNPRRTRIRDIDLIPKPAWDLFDIESYIAFNQPHGASRGRFIPMLATRGCPFACTFCTSPQMWTQRWVPRDTKSVVDEIEEYGRRYQVTDIHFEDLTAIVRREWIIEFCKEIVNRGLKITFQLPSGTRSEAIDDEAAAWMKRAGCHEFSFAPEAGDPRVLKAIKKQVQLPRLFESARSAMKAGINVGGFFIVGFPEDDWLSVLRTFKTIARCAIEGFASVNVNPYSPQPNTASFNALRQKGIIGEFDRDYFLDLFRFQDLLAPKVSYNERFSPRQIKWFVLTGFATFYFFYFASRPWRILRLLRDFAKGSSSDKSARAFSNLVKDYRKYKKSAKPTADARS
ncbi:MAG: B12-binding domain-containing radical SAM protein [Elusimicrobia bacterium]|nr:B12-binding domain-containing radical SAM protein [Elusimicrobiota bacterium]